MQHAHAGNTQSTPGSHSGAVSGSTVTAPANNGNSAQNNTNLFHTSRGGSPNISAPFAFDVGNLNTGGAWTGGAFGPEISEGLEWLGALGTGNLSGWEGDGGYP